MDADTSGAVRLPPDSGDDFARLVWRVLDYTRVNLLVLAVGVVFLIGAGQGADVVLGLSRAIPSQVALFYFGVIVWAWQSWFWARFMVDLRLADIDPNALDPEQWRHALFLQWYPRVLALIAFSSATVVLAATHGVMSAFTLANVGLTAIFLLLVVFRRRMGAAIARDRSAPRLLERYGILVFLTIGVSSATCAISLLAALIDPVAYGFFVGSAAVLFIALASILLVGSILIWRTSDSGWPVIKVLAVAVIAFSFTNDNHVVRTLGNGATVPDAWASVETWMAGFPQAQDEVPGVFVATAGGGIRAAYWTATVLSTAEQRLAAESAGAPFAQHLVAISGVSGGSVGSAFYTAALSDLPGETDRATALTTALSYDFLGPALTGLMYQDMLQMIVPVAIFEGRGAILERAFERAWTQASGGNGLKTPVSELGSRLSPWLPRLLFNGTNSSTGQRMIGGTLPVLDRNGFEVILNSLDTTDYLIAPVDGTRPDMRLSTAAHNSARFPVISPGGVLARGRSAIVDGGYFENFGAQTLHDLLSYLVARSRLERLPKRLRPIVVQISSDPTLGAQISTTLQDPEIDGSLFGLGVTSRLWNLIGAPLGGLTSTRGARGVLAAKALRTWVQDLGYGQRDTATVPSTLVDPIWLHFRMTASGNADAGADDGCTALYEAEPPLGWVLSAQSTRAIDHMIACDAHNLCQMDTLIAALAGADLPQCYREEAAG